LRIRAERFVSVAQTLAATAGKCLGGQDNYPDVFQYFSRDAKDHENPRERRKYRPRENDEDKTAAFSSRSGRAYFRPPPGRRSRDDGSHRCRQRQLQGRLRRRWPCRREGPGLPIREPRIWIPTGFDPSRLVFARGGLQWTPPERLRFPPHLDSGVFWILSVWTGRYRRLGARSILLEHLGLWTR